MYPHRFEFQNCCRMCGENESFLINLFEEQSDGMSLPDMIFCCTQLKIEREDNRPPNICRKCVDKLNISYGFFTLAKTTEEKFQQIALQSVILQPIVRVARLEESSLAEDRATYDFALVEIKEEHEPIAVVEDYDRKVNMLIVDEQLDVEQHESICDPNDNKEKEEKRKGNQKGAAKKPQKSWECYKCNYKSKILKELRSHMKEHNDVTPFACTICGMHYSKQLFKRHLCRGTSVKCAYCKGHFNSTVALLKHLEGHENELVMNKCTKRGCAKLFSMKSLLKWHTESHDNTTENFICYVCGNQRFSKRRAFMTHMGKHLKDNGKSSKFILFPFY